MNGKYVIVSVVAAVNSMSIYVICALSSVITAQFAFVRDDANY